MGGGFGPQGGGAGFGGGYQQPYQAYPQQYGGYPNDNYPPYHQASGGGHPSHRLQQPFGSTTPFQQQQPYGQPPYLLPLQQQQLQQPSYHLQQQQQQPGIAVTSPWRAATAADGQIYYYNAITQETQWDKPVGMP